ncbi:MAG: GNAT family N-acetyltransferase [Lewinellaceae bacterium]|nr:GNAT family N-acetyltransferase [Lewinellaceae bacterium]
MTIAITTLAEETLPALARLALELWPECRYEEEYRNAERLLRSPHDAVFLARAPDGACIAFIQLSLRHDYVEGTDSSPVGYVEGIYVQPGHRRTGIARRLVQAGEAWCREHGCAEMASDAEIDNLGSQAFHEGIGFEEVNRVVCYRKRIA